MGLSLKQWIPAFAGMTTEGGVTSEALVPPIFVCKAVLAHPCAPRHEHIPVQKKASSHYNRRLVYFLITP